MKKIITLFGGFILLLALSWPVHSETQWQQVATHGTQFSLNGSAITITHSTVDDGLDYIQQDFDPVQDVTFEFDAKIGAEYNDSHSLVLESSGGNTTGGLWLFFSSSGLYDGDIEKEVAPITFDTWYHYQVVSTRNKLLVFVNGELVYERTGLFQPRSFLRFRDYGRCSGSVTSFLNNVRVTVHGTIGSHGTQFVTENDLLKVIHSTVPNGLDYYQQNFQPLPNAVIEFDAKIGSLNHDNYSLLMESDGDSSNQGLRFAFNQNKLCYYYNNSWREIATVPLDQWVHYRIISCQNQVEIYVDGELKYSQSGTFLPRSYFRFKDFGLCSGTVINYIGNFKTRAYTDADSKLVYDNFDYLELTGWEQQVSHGTQFSQSGNTIRIIHTTAANGLDYIKQTFTSMPEAVFEFDAKLGSENHDDFSLVFESDGGYSAADGLGLAFKGNLIMAYEGADWQRIFTVPFDVWQHYRIVSTPWFLAIYINDDLKYKRNGYFKSRSFMQFSDFGLSSGPVTNYLANVRVRPVSGNDQFTIFDDFDNQELTGWNQMATHGTQFSQSGNDIRIIHGTTPNGFDSIEKSFAPLQDTVFEFDVKLGSENNDNFSLLVESDGGYKTADGLGLAFKANQVMSYINNQWEEIFEVPFNTWMHYRIVSTASWIAIYINDDLKYKRNGTFKIRSFVKFSDFGACSGMVTNYITNVRTRQVTEHDRFMIFDDFNDRALSGWTQRTVNGTRFSQNGNGVRISHSTVPGGFDYIQQSFTAIPEAVFEFDAKLGSENHNDFSLLFESDGGYAAADGLGLAFKGNVVLAYSNNEWRPISTIPFNEWRHYRIVSTPGWIALYIQDDLKYKVNGSFRSRSFMKFSDFGLCGGTVTNYLANIQVRAAADFDKFIVYDDFNGGSITGWNVMNPDGSQFFAENSVMKISHVPGTFRNDYMQRTFEPMQNMVLEFDAKIGSENNGNYSLMVETNDMDSHGFLLAFYPGYLVEYNTTITPVGWYRNLAAINLDEWVHYRIVYTATKIDVYVGGELKGTFSGSFNPRTYVRFSSTGYVAMDNYIDNVCIRPYVPEASSTNLPEWTANWTANNPNGVQFIQNGNLVTINHTATGIPGGDYLQRSFRPLQNIAFEFDAKIGEAGNTGGSLYIESDGGASSGGLYLSFTQNHIKGCFGGPDNWYDIQTVDYGRWYHYRIVSTLKTIQVYVDGILKYSYAGTFNPRSYLRFSNAGECTVTNYIQNINIQEVIPDATFTDAPDWTREWVIHNPSGTQYIRENGVIKIRHVPVAYSFRNDYMQRTFDPMQNMVLEFDAKIGSENNGNYSLMVETNDMESHGFLLAFYPWKLTEYNMTLSPAGWYRDLAIINLDEWIHYRIVYTATKIDVYVGGEWKGTFSGTFNPRSYVRFSSTGYVAMDNYVDNVCIRPYVPESNSINLPEWTSNWTANNPNGVQFIQNGNLVTINHTATGIPDGDYLQRSFRPLQNVAFEFDAKIGETGNTGWSLYIESDGGAGNGGLYLGFTQNHFKGCFGGPDYWYDIQTVDYGRWYHYRIVSTLKTIQVYVDGILKYSYAGTFNPRSYLRFSNAGECTVTNYIQNINIQEVIPDATFTDAPDWTREWVIHNPSGTQYIRENGAIKIRHVPVAYTFRNDYMQRTFEPMQNMVLEFDAKIGSENNGNYSLMVETNDMESHGFLLAFYPWKLTEYNMTLSPAGWYRDLAIINLDEWIHYRIVYTATKIDVYVGGEWKGTFSGTFNPRTYVRFSSTGYVSMDNYIDNVCIRPYVPEASSTDLPEWTSGWMTIHPDGTQFIQTDNLVTIKHVLGYEGNDYLQRSFIPLQNVAFEFDAKIGSAGNTNKNLIIESDGGPYNGGLYLAFNQNNFMGYFDGSWPIIQSINYNQWNHYRIVSTQKKIQVYVNGVLKYTYSGTFNPRSFLRFSNAGACTVTNYIRNITISPIIPDAAFTDAPDWTRDWVIHNPSGTQFIRENGGVKISHVPVAYSFRNDYMQRTFEPVQNMVLEFDAKIGSENNGNYSLMVETNDMESHGFLLAFYPWKLTEYNMTLSPAGWYRDLATINLDEWIHYRIEYTATKIDVYVGGELKGTFSSSFNPRTYVRFSSTGYVSMDNYIDNVCIRTIESENTSETTAGLPPNAKVTNPDGTKFEWNDNAIKIEHKTGSWGADFLQYDFSPMQDVVMEFDAKLGDLNNTDYSLLVESDGGMQSDGLCLAFCQNYLQMYTGSGFETIGTVDFNKWNYYRIVSTATEIKVYVNGVIQKTLPGTFATRSFIRFANSGLCNPVNYIANVRVTALASWDAEWYLNNLDTKPPILSGVWPTNNTNLTTANITVGGRISDASEVTVTVNGVNATIAYGQFSAAVSLNQGTNQLTIIAQDANGNTTQLTRTVQVDSILPAEFTPVADPVSWSTNTQPVITFGTTDDGSGIHHYELLLDDTLVNSSVTSPYQFSMVPDGEHTVKINAVDGFGNIRSGQVKVYVDTTAPGQTQAFRVVPGNGKITLRWTAPDPDVTQYRIARTPAWTETFRSTDQTELVDTGLENGAQYQYTIWAIDHAQNEGPAAESRQGTVGLAEAEYVPDQGVIVEYDNVTLFVHPESLPDVVESIKITQIESQDLAVKSFYPIISPIYQFSATAKTEDASLVDVEHIAFEKDFQGMLAYDPALLPEGYPEKNLGVYYFDPMWGRWFKVEKSGVDTVHHQILFSTNHFTSFSVQPTMIEDLSPQQLKDVGYSPFKTQVTHQGINVSPEGGSAMTEMTELVLPGRYGFDFVLKRTYDTATACGDAPGITQNASLSIKVGENGLDFGNAQGIADQLLNQGAALPDLQLEEMIKKYFQNNGDYCYSMGLGWRLNLPYIRGTNSSVLVRLPSGGFYSIYQMKIVNNDNPIGAYRTLTMENHEGEDFTFIVTQARLDINYTSLVNDGLRGLKIPGWQLISAKLILKDGTTYEMDALGRTTKIIDPTGLNTINLSYGGPALSIPGYSFGLHLDNITDSMGRKIKFEYDQRFLIPKIKRIWLENDNLLYHREINYTLESALGGGQSVVPLLKKARDVNGREWNYQYDNQLFFNGGISVKVNIVAAILDFFTNGQAGKIMGVDDITISGRQQLMWVFPLNEAQGPGIGRTRIDYDKKSLTYITGEQADYFLGVFPTAIQISYDLSQRLYAKRIAIYKGSESTPVQTVNYDYQVSYYSYGQFYTASSVVDNGRTRTTYYYKPFTKRRNRWLDWSDYLAEQSNREIAGLQSGSYAAGCFSENPFNYDVLSYNTASVTCDSQTGLTFENNQTTDYDMDTLRPLTQITYHGNGSNSHQVTYRFDGWGNMIYQEDVSTGAERTNQTKTWMYYWPNQPGSDAPWLTAPFAQVNIERTRYNLPLGKIVANINPVGNGASNVTYLQTNYQYSPLGQQTKSAQWDGSKWLTTQLDYDATGNLVKKTGPTGHETVYEYDTYGFPVLVTEKAVRDAKGITGDITTRTGYEFISGWKLWQQDPRGYVTEYQYDALGRTTRITAPDTSESDDQPGWIPSGDSPAFRANNPTTMISYNDTGLYSIVTDPELNQTKYQFDNLGRLEQLIKYRIVNGMYVPAATTRLEYNNWGDITSITDPNGKITRYQYDALGRNMAIQYPDNEGRNPVKRMDYDYTSDILTITDENGNMSYEYHDVQGRTYKKKLTSDNMTIVSEIYYDGLGNEVMTVDPKGSITTKTYNQLNQLMRIDLPTETFRENGVSVTVTPYQRFTYNDAGFKIAEIHALAGSGTEITNSVEVDELGRTIRTITPYTDRGVNKEAVTEIYYDDNGNKIKVVDANNTSLPVSQQKASLYEYSAANLLLSETDPAGNKTAYTYDLSGNRTSMTDPRGDSGHYTGDFTIIYHYDDLNRLVRGELPAAPGQTVKPEVNLTYDVRGNLLERLEPDGAKTTYTYTARNKVATETTQGSGKSYTVQHRYDLAGNEIETTDARGNTVTKEYNELNQVKKISYPETQGKVNEYFRYDENGNKVEYINGLSVATNYKYDRYSHLIEVRDGKNGITSYQYDRWGNMTQAVNALGHTTNYQYDELNRLLQETDPQGYVKQYGYDLAGNRLWSIDPNGTRSDYQYTANNLVSQVTLQNGETAKDIYYLYDEAGFRKWVKYGNVITEYNTTNGSYVPDPYGRIYKETKNFDGQSFTVGYDYDVMGRLSRVIYPKGQVVDYQYNNLGQLQGVPGFVNETPVYDNGGMLTSIKAANGVVTSYNYDQNGRLTNLSYNSQTNVLKSYQITYDGANNIVKKNDDVFRYDALNQLLLASIKGNFENNPDEKGPDVGRVRDDFKGQRTFEFELTGIDLTELDYAAGCIGVDLGAAFKITRLELQPNSPVHRVTNKKSIRLYYSQDNNNFIRIADWKMAAKQNGGMEITLNTPVTARYFKVKSMHDERNFEFEAVNQAEFTNTPQDLIRLYYLMPSRQEEYTYDAIGNRTKEVVTQRSPVVSNYTYYPNSSRLQSNEKYAFEYDANGNLVKKTGLTGDKTVWNYNYDLFNRLLKVMKNDIVVSEYMYDEGGLRIKKTSPKGQIYYVFDSGGNVLYEQENREYMKYIYVLGKHFARIDGNLDNGIEKKYFYHTDHLGSTVLVTDEAGQQVWSAEYTPFGKQVSKEGELEKAAKFTGKDLDEDTGLYYFNARWYDQELGRFISEDQVNDPNSPNLYTYSRNNPLTVIDPSGNRSLSSIGLTTLSTGLSQEKLDEDRSDVGTSSASGQAAVFISIKAPNFELRVIKSRWNGFISLGDRGKDVELLQSILAEFGYLDNVDGKYGYQTEEAVKSLQRDLGLAADGTVGPQTKGALLELYINRLTSGLISANQGTGTQGNSINWSTVGMGFVQTVSGVGQIIVGASLLSAPEPLLTKVVGVYAIGHGASNAYTGVQSIISGFNGGGMASNVLEMGYTTLGSKIGQMVAGEQGQQVGSVIGRGVYIGVDTAICVKGTVDGISTLRDSYKFGRTGEMITNLKYGWSETVPQLTTAPGLFKVGSSVTGLANDVPSYSATINSILSLW